MRDDKRRDTEFLSRTLLGVYLQRRDEEASLEGAADPAGALIRDWITLVDGSNSRITPEHLTALGDAAAKANCEDPGFAYCYGRVLRDAKRLPEAARYLTIAADRCADAGYPETVNLWAARHAIEILKTLKQTEYAANLQREMVRRFPAATASKIYFPGEQRLLFNHLAPTVAALPADELEEVLATILDTDMDPWVKHMVAGDLEVRVAWEARGTGWARDVKKEAWQLFERHIKLARDHFRSAWEIDPSAPEAATELIGIARSASLLREDVREWFDRAVAAQFDHLPAYSRMRNALLPRWGGSHRAMRDFGRECLETGRFDTMVPYQLMEIVRRIASDIGGDISVYQRSDVSSDLLAMADGYLGEPSMSAGHGWYRALKIAIAVHRRDWELARTLVDAETEPLSADAFTQVGLDRDGSLGEIFARSREAAPIYAEAERFQIAGRRDEAVARFRALLKDADEHSPLFDHVAQRIDAIEFERSFEAGDWTPLSTDPSLRGWKIVGGNWSSEEGGLLVGKATSSGLQLLCERDLGVRFQLRGSVIFRTSPYRNQFNIGFYFGQRSGQLRSSVRLYHNEDYVALFDGREIVERVDTAVEDSNSFLIQRWDDSVSAWINGNQILQDARMQAYGLPSHEALALGGRYWYDGPRIDFENLEVRKLTAKPVPDASPPAPQESDDQDPPPE
jgi:hypothetical protein